MAKAKTAKLAPKAAIVEIAAGGWYRDGEDNLRMDAEPAPELYRQNLILDSVGPNVPMWALYRGGSSVRLYLGDGRFVAEYDAGKIVFSMEPKDGYLYNLVLPVERALAA